MPVNPSTADFVSLVEDHERYIALLKDEIDRDQRWRELHERSTQNVSRYSIEQLEKAAIWLVDYTYRLVNRIESFDSTFLAYFAAIGRPLWSALAAQGLSFAYLVDNEVPEERLHGTKHVFNSMGLVVASPELLVPELGDLDEATALAARLYAQSVAKGHPVAWISGQVDLEMLRQLGRVLDGTAYVGVFRNAAPVDGSEVLVFRDSRRQIDIRAD